MGKRQVENEGEEFDTDPGVGCDLSQVWFSNPAASKVQPPVGSTLRYVSSGRGLQNYTCTNGTYKTYGPFTQMYDVSCVITKRPSLLPLLQNILASFPRDDPASATDAIAQVYGKDEAKLGETILTDPKYHLGDFFFQFFDGTVSPLFDFRKVKGDDQFFYGKVKASEPDIIDGKNNIPWLNIGRANSTDPSLTGGLCDVILRDYTAGGVQPKECSADQEGDFLAVEYSAHYWYYGSGN
ncbi:hypothetical protein BT69DRAFT_200499 [Atractiella rhizophila]|nr:hypothetical protein BT69DRAFT_200499 [Atractiella rhizophila]